MVFEYFNSTKALTWEEALAEWNARGFAEGQVRGSQETILQIARRLCSSIPPDFEATVRSIDDSERLRRILLRMLDADSIDAIDLE